VPPPPPLNPPPSASAGQLIHEAFDGVEVARSKGREGVVGDEAQRVRVHDTPHPQASTFHGWDEKEEKNMDSISINSNHSMEKDSKVSSSFFFFSFFFFFFFFFFFSRKFFSHL
jgi:hypothetical protein